MIRLTIVQSHPVQYLAPWFRDITANCPEIDLTVLYASRPRPEQQGTGFDCAFEWDTPLLDGYKWKIVRESVHDDDFSTRSFWGLNVRGIGAALDETAPDVVLVPGWYSVTLVRAILWARFRGIPVIYRGDTNNEVAPGGWRRLPWRLKTRLLLSLYSAYLSVGRRSREYLISNGAAPTRIYASPACVDNNQFAEAAAPYLQSEARAAARERLAAGPRDFAVLFVGKLEAKKRPLDALRAVAAIGAETTLIVAGSGPLEPELRREAARLGVRLTMLGFVNQRQLGEIYSAVDCLVLPSGAHESWGLVVNEAFATGLPVVVSEHVGCGPDLVLAGETGERHRTGDVEDLGRCLARVRERGGRTTMADACRARAARYDFSAAAVGLVAACQALAGGIEQPARVIACCGGMVIVSGLERMTFEVLRVVRDNGGPVHCILNNWENERIVELAEHIGASWSTGFYVHAFGARPRTVRQAALMCWDVLRTSACLVGSAVRFRPTHILTPDHITVIRNAPALALFRALGVDVVFRLAMAPERGALQRFLWRYVLPPFVTRFVPISRFCYQRLLEEGVEQRKITLVRNALSRRVISGAADDHVVALARSRPTLLTVGQIAPFKGTHLAVDAVLRLIAEGVDVQGMIVGRWPTWPPDLVEYAEALRARVAAAGASDRVHFVGPRENVLALMKASYVLSAPILCEEAFCNVVLEARSVGLPVVTFARGALTELVEHQRTGFVCETSDADGLLGGLRYYLHDASVREEASAQSLYVTTTEDRECTKQEFDRRWRTIFSRTAFSVSARARTLAIP